MRRARPLAPLLVALAGCGPTNEEVALALVLALVLVVPIVAALNWSLYRLWRSVRQVDPPSLRSVGGAMLATLLGAIVGYVAVPGFDDFELVGIAFCVGGGSYLTVMTIALSVGLARKKESVFRSFWWPPLVLYLLLLVPVTMKALPDQLAIGTFSFILYSGLGGLLGGPIFLILLGVSLVARRRASQRAEPE